MAEIKANAESILACADSILELCGQYDTQINELFDTLSKINKTAWKGSSADLYVAKLSADRNIYTDFGDYLKYYGKMVKNIGDNVNTIIAKWEEK